MAQVACIGMGGSSGSILERLVGSKLGLRASLAQWIEELLIVVSGAKESAEVSVRLGLAR